MDDREFDDYGSAASEDQSMAPGASARYTVRWPADYQNARLTIATPRSLSKGTRLPQNERWHA
jgi:hypothetical protein